MTILLYIFETARKAPTTSQPCNDLRPHNIQHVDGRTSIQRFSKKVYSTVKPPAFLTTAAGARWLAPQQRMIYDTTPRLCGGYRV